MLTSGTAPPSGVKLSCEELTAPVEVPVVEAAKRADAAAPNRTSLPSMFAPTAPRAWSWGLPPTSAQVASAAEPAHSASIAAKIAQP